MGTEGRSAKAPFRVFEVENSAASFVRRLDKRLLGRTASGVGAVGCEPPGGQDALDEECRLTLVLAAAAIGLRLTEPNTGRAAVCAFVVRPA